MAGNHLLCLLPPSPVAVAADQVVLSGELDLATAPQLEMQLAGLDGDILIDCAGLTFIDCRGLRPLVSAHYRCTSRGRRLVLVNPPRCLTWLLELTDLAAVFEVQA
jgi:anti-sigma B factor antagonist